MLLDLMFRREQFPKRDYFNPYLIPPIHPSILETGIDVELVFSLITDAVKLTIFDYKDLDKEIPDIKFNEKGKVFLSRVSNVGNERIDVEDLPFIDRLSIRKDRLTDLGGGDGLYVDKLGEQLYDVPEQFPFLSRLMTEYSIKEVGKRKGLIIYRTSPNYRTHNIDHREIFIKNLVMLLNNETVRKNILEIYK